MIDIPRHKRMRHLVRRRGRHALRSESGVVFVLFAASLVVLIGTAALTVDYGWLFYNELNARKTAESAALAGVVYMPLEDCAAPSSGTEPNDAALDMASRNGYTNGVGSVSVSIKKGSTCKRLTVTVSDRVEPFFMKVFGYNSMDIRESATAEYDEELSRLLFGN